MTYTHTFSGPADWRDLEPGAIIYTGAFSGYQRAECGRLVRKISEDTRIGGYATWEVAPEPEGLAPARPAMAEDRQ